MFYSQFILAKKGPLGTIWIAAHLERKLRKNQVADTDIGVSVDSILFPEVPIALRLSSHLLLGVVRIYSRKVNYLFDDCSEALLKVKQAFRSTAVDLPPEESTAPYHSITLPETFDLDDFELPDNEILQGNYVDHHVSTREQITLQDSMEGVVYTNSQFGLDERFGDGDASQIGLDLDEVMLIDKAASMEHDDCSATQVSLSLQKCEKKEEIDDLPSAADVGECAQGPSTPGLEEPNLFGTQVDQVNNEVDDHNSADLVSVKSMQKVPSAHQRDEDVIDFSSQNNVKPVGVDLHHEDDDCLPVELDSKREQQEHLACMVVAKDQESLIPNDHCSASSPLTVSSNIECPTTLVPECAGGMISSSGIPEKMEDLHDEVLKNNEPLVAPLDQNVTNCVVSGGVGVNETTASPSCSHVTSDQENISCKHLSNMDGSRGPESDGHLEDDQTSSKNEVLNAIEIPNNEAQSCPIDEAQVSNVISPRGSPDQENISCKHLSNVDGSRGPESDGHLEVDHTLSKHEVLNAIEIPNNEEQSCPIGEAQVSNVISPRGSAGRPQVVDVGAQASQELKETESLNHISHEAVPPTEFHLRPCTSHLSQPSLSSVEGEKCLATDGSDPALGYHETIEPSVCEGNPDLGKSDVQIESRIFCDKVESINKSAASDMPEPEKMLSLAYQHDGEANDLPMESTPDNQGISEGHTGAAGIKCISGKKRSFTESTLTVQSVDLVESYGGVQSKRTAESIPDDDDLLSSILVGRRSSVLKMKPSPVVPEIVSMKRSRSAPRTSALKRKVLMDDMMVLHGDTIRQQLTNTEDIRRIRKKAPCTRHEILMIQRQSLEDEIFHESIFTGLSADFIILRNETFDLTGIKVCDNGLDSSFLEKTNDQEKTYSRTNTETHGVERNIEAMTVQLQGDAEAQPTEIPILAETHHSEVNLGSHDIDTHGHANIEAHGVERNIEAMTVQLQGDAEAQSTEIPILSETHQSEVNLGSHDIDTHEHANIVSHVKELDSSQNVQMNKTGGSIEVSVAENWSVGPGLESSSLTEVFENNLCMPNDFVASLPLMDKTNDVVGSMHTDTSSMPTDQNLNTLPILDESVEEKCDRSGVGATEIAEHSVEIKTQVQTDDLEANDLYASWATGSKETDEYNDNQTSFNADLPIDENGNIMLGGFNEDQIVASDLGCDNKDSMSGSIFSENTKVDCLHSVAFVLDEKETNPNEGNAVCQEVGLQSTMFPEISAIESPLVDHNDENVIDANDTGFLNVGDDEIIEDDDDFIPCAEGSHLENSGWSSRTRAVANYLQTLFDKEDLQGRQNLHLDSILAGKTRKEASRMFFETLVLKTRDYVHVEQTKPFSNIDIKPRMKLMKSDF